jgi:chemotaxis receptor (MCP) glutamine deamidase CheD
MTQRPTPPAASSLPAVRVVALDHFEVLPGDGVLQAVLDGSMVVCFYDAVEETGGMVHLRIIPLGRPGVDASDDTLAADLLLLDRCLESLRKVAPNARYWQARVVTHFGPDGILQPVGIGVRDSVCHGCTDSGVVVVQSDAEFGGPVTVAFRPAMGQLRKATL